MTKTYWTFRVDRCGRAIIIDGWGGMPVAELYPGPTGKSLDLLAGFLTEAVQKYNKRVENAARIEELEAELKRLKGEE